MVTAWPFAAAALPSASVPVPTVTNPVKEFEPVSVRVPEPDVVNPIEPPRTEPMVAVWPRLTVTEPVAELPPVPPALRLMVPPLTV